MAAAAPDQLQSRTEARISSAGSAFMGRGAAFERMNRLDDALKDYDADCRILKSHGSGCAKARDLRQSANANSSFAVGKWWEVLIKYAAPLLIGWLLVTEVTDRIQGSYENYGRVPELLAGWAVRWVAEGGPVPETGRYTFTTWHHYTKDSPLLESGLLGPVTLETSEVVPVQ